MGDEYTQNIDAHYEFVEFFLTEVYRSSLDSISVIIGDNCSTNKAIDQRFSSRLIGSHSHRFNLALLQDVLSVHSVITAKYIQAIELEIILFNSRC